MQHADIPPLPKSDSSLNLSNATHRRALSVGFILILSLLCSSTIETDRYWRDILNSCCVLHSITLRPNSQPTFTPFTSVAHGTSVDSAADTSQIHLDNSTLPSPWRLMQHACSRRSVDSDACTVAAGYCGVQSQLGGHTHRHTDAEHHNTFSAH